MTPKEIRARARLPLIAAAVGAGVSEATARLYEASPDSVKHPDKRAALDRYYRDLGAPFVHPEPPTDIG